MKNYIINI